MSLNLERCNAAYGNATALPAVVRPPRMTAPVRLTSLFVARVTARAAPRTAWRS